MPDIDEKEIIDVSDDTDEADVCQQADLNNEETQAAVSSEDLVEKSNENFLFILSFNHDYLVFSPKKKVTFVKASLFCTILNFFVLTQKKQCY